MDFKKLTIYGGIFCISLYGLNLLIKKYRYKSNKKYNLCQTIYSRIKKFPNENIYYFKIKSIKTIKNKEMNIFITITEKEVITKKETIKTLKSPFLPPFEDSIFIGKILDSHNLIFNKFMVVSPHVLLITKHYENQISDISDEDLKAIYYTLTIFDYKKNNGSFLFYNRGKNSGASQEHKHFQLIPKNDFKSDILNLISKNKNLNIFKTYKHSIKYYNLNSENYLIELRNKINEIINELDIDENTSYNMILDKKFIAVFLRKSSKALNKYSINCLGILGNFLVRSDEEFIEFEKNGIEKIFDEILVKNN